MKLIDLLNLIPNDSKVVVEDYDETIYEIRDGDNDINSKYNKWKVLAVYSGYYQIGVIIERGAKTK